MGELARKAISRVQNLFLDRLFVSLAGLAAFLAMIWVRMGASPVWTSSLLATAGVVLFAGWLLGALANRSAPVRNVSALMRVSSDDGFQAWSDQPENGLNPPGPLRRLVNILGNPAPAWLEVVLAISGPSSLIALAFLGLAPSSWLAAVHTDLVDLGFRQTAMIGLTGVSIVFQLRSWAREQASRLNSAAGR